MSTNENVGRPTFASHISPSSSESRLSSHFRIRSLLAARREVCPSGTIEQRFFTRRATRVDRSGTVPGCPVPGTALLVRDRDAPSNPFLRARNRTTEIGIRVRRDLPDIRQQPARRRTVRRRAQTLPCLSIRSFNQNCGSPTGLESSELARRIGDRRVHAVIARAVVHETGYCCCPGARSMRSVLRRPQQGRVPRTAAMGLPGRS